MAKWAGGDVLQEALEVVATVDHDVYDKGEGRIENGGDGNPLQDAPIDGKT
jgi:hypothetical protein